MATARDYIPPAEVTAVVYHHPCLDGEAAMAAALCFSSFIQGIKYNVSTGDLKGLDEFDKDAKIVFFDCAPKTLSELNSLRERFAKVMVVDHHHGNQENFQGIDGCFFDMTKSGCMLAWEYFHPHAQLPRLLKLVGERDIGKFDDPETVLIGHALMDPSTARGPVAFVEMILLQPEEHLEDLLVKGKEIQDSIQALIDSLVPSLVNEVEILSTKLSAVVVKIPDHRFVTYLGDHYSEKFPDKDFVVLVYPVLVYPAENDEWKLSFRTSAKGLDVSKIARIYGGNGHIRAAGATVKELPDWIKEEIS